MVKMVLVAEKEDVKTNTLWETEKGKDVLRKVFFLMTSKMIKDNSKSVYLYTLINSAHYRFDFKRGLVYHAIKELERLKFVEITKHYSINDREVILTKEGAEFYREQTGRMYPFFNPVSLLG